MDNQIELIPNSPDDLHCLQSAYLMIVKFYNSSFEIDWQEWSDITGYEEGKGTWASAGLLWMQQNGFSVKHMSLFDYDDFINNGSEYLLREFGDEVGSWQVEHSNIPVEQSRAKQLVEKDIWIQRQPSRDDIIRLLDDGYLLRCLVNSRKLSGNEGYIGHSVVVSGYNTEGFIIQDPGLPALHNRKVSYNDFESAWADPNSQAKELDIIKLIT